jgi:autotransporter-associated beta strand protein
MRKSTAHSRWEGIFSRLGIHRRKRQQKRGEAMKGRTFAIEPLEERALLSVTHTWIGDSGNWNDPAHWDNGVPENDDNLVFGVADVSTTNDVLSLTKVNSITFNANGISVSGTNPLTVTNGVAVTASVTGTVSISSPVALGGTATSFSVANSSSTVTLSGAISGVGELTKTGSGTLSLYGDNTYTGPTIVEAGTLYLNGNLNSYVTVNGGQVGGWFFLDQDLAIAARDALGMAPNGILHKTDVQRLKSLSADSNRISSLQGLQTATSLESLTLVPSDFSVHPASALSLSPLQNLPLTTPINLANSQNMRMTTSAGERRSINATQYLRLMTEIPAFRLPARGQPRRGGISAIPLGPLEAVARPRGLSRATYDRMSPARSLSPCRRQTSIIQAPGTAYMTAAFPVRSLERWRCHNTFHCRFRRCLPMEIGIAWANSLSPATRFR